MAEMGIMLMMSESLPLSFRGGWGEVVPVSVLILESDLLAESVLDCAFSSAFGSVPNAPFDSFPGSALNSPSGSSSSSAPDFSSGSSPSAASNSSSG